jgi:2-amino-4-hydroxy-6-hydroxymethyldihydropteridine diphosphokinase
MNEAYLILGGNIPDRMEYLQWAIFELRQVNVLIDAQSSIYETEAWGSNSIHAYLNVVLKIRTEQNAESLLEKVLAIEHKLGRQRNKENRNADRTIDIDILFFNSDVIKTPVLEIPHPRLHLRKFALLPMMELNKAYIHPVLNKNMHSLYDICEDTSEVSVYV